MDNKKLWFKRRRYGYGWTPVTWQGWLSVAFFVALIFVGVIAFLSRPEINGGSGIIWLLILLAADFIGIVLLGTLKGPSPKWRWGKKSTDNKHEDF